MVSDSRTFFRERGITTGDKEEMVDFTVNKGGSQREKRGQARRAFLGEVEETMIG